MMWDIGICRNFTSCEIDEVHLNMEDKLFEIHTVDVKCKRVQLECVMMENN
jgi:hypothetical protein